MVKRKFILLFAFRCDGRTNEGTIRSIWLVCNKNAANLQPQRHQPYLCIIAENLHSLRLAFKTFTIKRDTIKSIHEWAWKVESGKSYGFQIATNKTKRKCKRKQINVMQYCIFSVHLRWNRPTNKGRWMHKMHSKRCTNNLNSAIGLARDVVWFVWKLAAADLVINGDFSRAFMHVMRLCIDRVPFRWKSKRLKYRSTHTHTENIRQCQVVTWCMWTGAFDNTSQNDKRFAKHLDVNVWRSCNSV